MTTETRYFLPRQLDFLRETAGNVLYSGSVRAGKTYALCTKAVMRACHPRAREGLARKHRVTLTSTTLVTLLQGDGMNPPVLPAGMYEHNKQDGVIRIRGGGEIAYFGMDDPRKVGSRSLTGVGLDEAVEFDESDWDMLQTRVSVEVPDLSRQVYAACNPGTPSHFLAKRFGLAGGHQAFPDHVAYRTRSADNWFLPRDYIERIERLTGVARKRLVEGQWVGAEGLVYDNWDRAKHVRTRSGPWARTLIAVDDGFSNPFAALLIGLDGDDRMHVLAERYGSGWSLELKIRAIKELARKYGTERVIFDPSAAQLRSEVRDATGLATKAGDNDVAAGILLVRQRLEDQGDGEPGLTVDPRCENVQREMETYEYMSEGRTDRLKDKPKKENDHSCFAGDQRVYLAERGWAEIASVCVGDQVLTPGGFEPVLGAGVTGWREMVEVEFESGNRVVCTPDHRFLLDALGYGAVVSTHERSRGHHGEEAAVGWRQLVPVRTVLFEAEPGRWAHVPAPSGVGGRARLHPWWAPYPPRERGPDGQPDREPSMRARAASPVGSHDARAARGGAGPDARASRVRQSVARERGWARVAQGARRRCVEEAADTSARVRGLRRFVRDEVFGRASQERLLEQLQDAPVPRSERRTDAAVRARAVGSDSVYCLATPSRCFLIAGGYVARNCDALRYGVMDCKRATPVVY